MTSGRLPARTLGAWVTVPVLALSLATHASAGEAYYLLVFGQQRVPREVNNSHTFATFVKVSWSDNCSAGVAPHLEAHTISWLPASLRLRSLALRPEYGSNLDLHATLRWAQASGMRTSLWGPYAIRPELYQAALRQLALLESGRVLYKVNDTGYRSDEVLNCIRAVGSIVTGQRRGPVELSWGETASYHVLCRMEPWILDSHTIQAWVGSALGLDRYPIVYRDWAPPLSGPVAGPVFRFLGNERAIQATYGRAAVYR